MTMRIGFIGLGLMGLPMARRLCGKGYTLNVHNRTKWKAQELLDAGIRWCDTPCEVASRSTITFTMLSTSGVLEKIALGEDGILEGMSPGGIHVDHGTVAPELTERLFETYRNRGMHFIHCPVLGSVPQATDGTLLLFAGGDHDAIERARPILERLGSKTWVFERVETASHVKLVCNSFIAGMILTLGQALAYCKEAEVDGGQLLAIIASSALDAPMYRTKGASILAGNFTPRFFLEHLLKDVTLFTESAQRLGVSIPLGDLTRDLAQEAMAAGFGSEDYSAIVKMFSSDVSRMDERNDPGS